MRVRMMANSITRGVNSNIPNATLLTNMGFTIAPNGKQLPSYANSTIEIQTQSIETEQLQHLNLVSQQGQYSYIYADGLISAQRRTLSLGSDLLVFAPYGESDTVAWRVLKVIESYSDWVKLLGVRLTALDAEKLGWFGFEGTMLQPLDQGVFDK